MKHIATQYEIAGAVDIFNLAGETIRQESPAPTRKDTTPDMFAVRADEMHRAAAARVAVPGFDPDHQWRKDVADRVARTTTCKFCRKPVDLNDEGATYRDGTCAHDHCADANEYHQSNQLDSE